MTKKQKRALARILIGVALFAAGLFFKGYYRLGFMLAAWAVAGWPVVRKAVKNIARGSVFDEHFLMTVATVGAFALGEYPEGAAVMIFFQIGELFESLAVERSRRSIASLMDLRPDSAFLWHDGEVEEVDPDEIRAGDILLVKPGQRIPVDGIIVEGDASLDTAQITGESLPVQVGPGQQVLSGCIDLSGVLKIRAYDMPVRAQNAASGIGAVALACDAVVPVVVGPCAGLVFDDARPGIFARGLVKVTVNRKVEGVLLFHASKDKKIPCGCYPQGNEP